MLLDLKEMLDDHYVDLRNVERQTGILAFYVRKYLELENVMPVRDCECPAFCLYWLSEVNTVFPDVTF